jgi:hypothetical protein
MLLQFFYLWFIYECVALALLVLNHLVFNYLMLLIVLVKKILEYPNIIYINIAFAMALLFAYCVLKLILENINRTRLIRITTSNT